MSLLNSQNVRTKEGEGGLCEGVAAAAMFVESVVCSQEHQFPEFPCCRKAKQQKTNWRDEGA